MAAILAFLGALALPIAGGAARAGANPAQAGTNGGDVVRVETGTLKGIVEDKVINFRGIPYAAPPVGDLRWAAPKPAAAWSGVRDASKFAPMCPQGTSLNEDCLYLNVTVPRGGSKSPKPVMVWLHGGGLSVGTPNTYDARRMVTQGDVIFVGVEFRVNVFGFFGIDGLDGSGTFGFQDQQAALRWVKRNIAQFGGDPNNVTVFGESGGGVSTCAQLVSPRAKGLFHKVIMQSGSCSVSWPKNGLFLGIAEGAFYQPRAVIEAKGAKTAETFGCAGKDRAAVLACLRKVPAEKIAPEGANFYTSAFGTDVLPIDPAHALEQGKYNKVAVLAGVTRDEARAIASGYQLMGKPITDENYVPMMREAFGDKVDQVLAQYPMARYGRGVLAWSAAHSDRVGICTQLHDAKLVSKKVPTYFYEFADPKGVGLVPFLPDLPSGASHSSELPLLFDLADGPYDLTTGKIMPMSDQQKALSEVMIQYWTQFARTSNPNGNGAPRWPRFDAAKAEVQILAPGPDGIKAANIDAAHQCDFWAPFIMR